MDEFDDNFGISIVTEGGEPNNDSAPVEKEKDNFSVLMDTSS
jgi:hypothetical protein